ncbi:hypothetical protein LTR37_002484 [Vermiconidia calcicola]|uniref:Uncharacterized protein n=1 Tax=Vermiconidia calcicola TaxID=1690605 RepID=A0ACC3NVM1_9PEZI|nr:hypothetical protein LTR37_002484 [Vermiconidia calcicola]
MARKRKFAEQLEGQYVEQNSPLLQLPAELRDMIYNHVAKHEDSIAIIPEAPTMRVAFASPFALVCRQVRGEYEQMYRQSAVRYAKNVTSHLTNFINEHTRTQLARTLDCLPLPAVDVDRRYSIHIRLTNTVDSSLDQLRTLLGQPLSRWKIRISYDPRSFDEAYFCQLVPKLRWIYGSRANSPHDVQRWFAIQAAFEDAFTRYSAQDRLRRGRRKGKRLNARTSWTKKK